MKRTTRPYAPTTGTPFPYVGATKYWSVSNYDALGRTISTVAPDGLSTTNYIYEGATVKVVDAKGKWKKFVKDAVGNLVTVWEPNPGSGTADLDTTYSYDQFDRLTGVTKLRGSTAQPRSFAHSPYGVVTKTEPETGTTNIYYRGDNRVAYKIDAKQQKIEYVYEDDLQIPAFPAQSRGLREIRKYNNTAPQGQAPNLVEDLCQRIEMFYDGTVPDGDFDYGVSTFVNGRLTGVRYRGLGRPGPGCPQTFVEQYAYTQYGARARKRVKLIRGAAVGVLDTIAEYDGEGRLKSVQYPVTGRKVQYGFNDRGLPVTLTDVTPGAPVPAMVTNVVYGPAGEMTQFVTSGGAENRGYNSNGQMTSLNGGGLSISYNYPSAGQNNGKIDSITQSGETISYVYDSLQRLTLATSTSGWAQSYDYDLFGNLYNKSGPSGASGPGGTGLRDANGNQTSVSMIAGSEMPDAFNLTFDVSNRMTQAMNAAGTMKSEYDYDPGNKRIWERRTGSSGGEWVHFYGVTGQRLGRYTFTVSGGTITFAMDQTAVYFGGKLVQKQNMTPTLTTYWPTEDRLGSVGRYLPYGENLPAAAGTNAGKDNEKFATYTRDGGTGLDYADQRWYVPGTGRFLTADPYQASAGAGDPGSWNRLAYVEGDLVNWVDSRGLFQQHPCKLDPGSCEPEPWPNPMTPDEEVDPNQDNGEGTKLTAAKTDALRAKKNSKRNGEALAALAALSEDCKSLLNSKMDVFRGAPSERSFEHAIMYTISFVESADITSYYELGDLGYVDNGNSILSALGNDYAIAGRGQARDVIVLNTRILAGEDPNTRNGLLVHEALHAYYKEGLNDIDLYFELFGERVDHKTASTNLTKRFAEGNCKKK